jgi:hypothetical protein
LIEQWREKDETEHKEHPGNHVKIDLKALFPDFDSIFADKLGRRVNEEVANKSEDNKLSDLL